MSAGVIISPSKSRDHKLFKYVIIGQHARCGDYVSENSGEGVKNGNVDKIRWRSKFQVSKQKIDFWKTKNMEPSEIQFRRASCQIFLTNMKL